MEVHESSKMDENNEQKSHFSDFLSETSLHGVRFLANREYNIFRRILWCIFILSSFIYFVLNFSQSLTEFLDYNSIISESVFRAEFDEGLEFPAVTFCPNSAMRKSKFLELYPDLLEANLERYRASLLNTSPNLSIITSNPNFREFVDEVGVTIENTFLRCRYNGSLNCSEYIHSFLYPFSYCFTFNSKPLARYHNSTPPQPIRIKKADPDVAVSFVLNADVEEYTYQQSKHKSTV